MTALPVETPKGSANRIHALDGMRGLAALGVMLFHFALQLRPEGLASTALKFVLVTGPRLELFFVLSGMLVTGLLYDAKNREHYYRNFYARRMLRILPLYYGALTILFVIPFVIGAEQFQVPLRDQLWYWFYLQNFNPLPPRFIGLAWHLWSLAIEQQFYLVWPIVILRTSRVTALRICVALVLVSITYRTFGSFEGIGQGTIWPTPARLDGIAAGSAIALLMRGPRGLETVRRRLPLLLALSAGYIALHTTFDYMNVESRPLLPLYFTATATLFACLLVAAMHAGEGRAASMLRSRFLGFFGKYGYGLYVFHVPLIGLAALAGFTPGNLSGQGSELGATVLYLAVMTGISSIAALISWHMWEKQFLKLKPYVVKSRGRPEAASSLKSSKGQRPAASEPSANSAV